MTHITQLTWRKPMFNSRILTMMLAGFVLVVLQSTVVHGQWNTNGNNINNTNTGNVGIGTGTTSPSLPLDVRGNTLVINTNARAGIGNYDSTSMAQGVGGGIQFGGKFDTSGTTAGFASISGIKENGANNDFSSALVFTTRANPNTQTERMRISSTGNVGIGTATPANRLVVTGDGSGIGQFGISGCGSNYVAITLSLTTAPSGCSNYTFTSSPNDQTLYINRPSGNAIRFRENNVNAPDQLVIASGGNVGIGTASPELRLDARVPNTTTDFTNNVTYASAFGNVSGKRITIGYDETGEDIGVIQSVYTGVGFKNLSLNPNGGNVGIGTTTPTKKLDVNGDTNVTGNFNTTGTITGGNIVAKYQDVAEWVQSSQDLPAGTVVVLDQTKSNQVIASSQAYDTRVAGVISSQPGITLGENGAGKVLVATTGRVRIKVDASHGAIQVGDLLVTSDMTGVAMKSQPIDVGDVQIHRPGTLIGKALEPFEKGTGEILVLLSLQ